MTTKKIRRLAMPSIVIIKVQP